MIYDTKGAYFSSFLTSSKHKPSSEEVVGALNDIRQKVRRTLFSVSDRDRPRSTRARAPSRWPRR